MLRLVDFVRTDVSEERNASIVFLRSVHRLLVTGNVVPSSHWFCHPDDGEDMFLRNVTRGNIPEDGILHSHRRASQLLYVFHILPFLLHKYTVFVCS
jgi:hypothetical protein